MKWIKANKSMPPMFKDVEWRNANGGNIPLGKMSAIEIYKKAGPNINSFEWLDESLALVEDRADGWINVEDKAPELQQSVAFIVDSRPGSDYNGKVYGGKYLGYNFGEHEFVLPGICFSAKLWQPLPPPPNPTITNAPK